MAQQCKFTEQCPIAKYFVADHWDSMLNRYCQGHYDKCHRYQLLQQNQPVSDETMPWDGVTEFNQV